MQIWGIKNVPILNELNPRQVHNLLSNAEVLGFKQGTFIGKLEEKSNLICIVLKGSLNVFSDDGIVMYILKEKNFWEGINALSVFPRGTSVEARTDTILVRLDKAFIECFSGTDSPVCALP